MLDTKMRGAKMHAPLAALSLLVACSTSLSATVPVVGSSSPSSLLTSINDGLIQVVGRTQTTDEGGISYDMPGVSVSAEFTGATEVSATYTREGDVYNVSVSPRAGHSPRRCRQVVVVVVGGGQILAFPLLLIGAAAPQVHVS